jgi:drug/metabolite transporter (DMT)-like permease
MPSNVAYVDSRQFLKSFIWLTICSICWALPPSLGKLMGTTIPPVFIAWFRLLFASILLTVLFIPNKNVRQEFKRSFHLSKTDFIWLIVGGALEGIHYVFYFYALHYTSALSVSILVNVGEIFVALSGFIFFKEKMTKKFFLAILLTLIGILLIVTQGDFSQLGSLFNSSTAFGDFLIIMSALLFSFYAVAKKKLINKTGSVPLVAMTFFIGQLVLVPMAIPDILNAASYPQTSWILLILMAIFGSALGYYSFAQGIKYTNMSTAGIITLSSPVFAIIFSILLVPGESLTTMFLVGSAFIISSIFLISTKPKNKETIDENSDHQK